MPIQVWGVILVILVVVAFIITYVLNKRTPIPEGCEITEENCSACNNTACAIRKRSE